MNKEDMQNVSIRCELETTVSAPSPPKIVYIAGYGRSGSSILGVLLGSHPEVFNAGALGQSRAMVRNGGTCSCGLSLKDCPFWSNAVRLHRGHDSPVRQDSLGLAEFAAHRTDTSHVIDGSKTTYRYALHPYHYVRDTKEVFIVHLVRHPSGVLKSALKGRNSRLERGDGSESAGRSFERFRTFLGWFHANLIAMAYGWLYSDRYIRVAFEELCSDPSRELARIGKLVGLDLSPVAERIRLGQSFSAGHALGGNRLLRAGDIVFRQSFAGEEPLSGVWGVIGNLAATLFRAKYSKN